MILTEGVTLFARLLFSPTMLNMFACLSVLQDLVTWVTLGTYHIPQLENTPNTATVGTTLSLYLSPFNFFSQDPSMASRDAVRVFPRDAKRPLDGAVVERYNNSTSTSTCNLPSIPLPDQELAGNSADLFS